MDDFIIGGKKYVKTAKSVKQIQYEQTHELNVRTMESPAFKTACATVGLPETKRQARKFRMKKGKAYKEGRE